MLDWIQYPGVALSLTGAWLVSSPQAPRRRVGFAIWIVSNVVLITWAVSVSAWGLVGMYSFFTVTSARGVRNNG